MYKRQPVRDLGYPLDLWRRDTKLPRARRGGAPRAGGWSPRPSADVCAEPLLLDGSPETRGVPSSGAGPPPESNVFGGVVSVGGAGPGQVVLLIFASGGLESVLRQLACTEKKNVRRQNLDPSLMAKNRAFCRFGEGAYDAVGSSRPLDHGQVHLISSRPSSTFTVVLPDTKWVGGGLILCRDQRPIVA